MSISDKKSESLLQDFSNSLGLDPLKLLDIVF